MPRESRHGIVEGDPGELDPSFSGGGGRCTGSTNVVVAVSDEDVPVRVVGGQPGVRAIGISTARGEIVLR